MSSSIPILHQSSGWIAVNKPPGCVVVPARNEDPRASLWRTLEAERGERLWAVHRLDRDTSGTVLFARTAAAHRALSMAFEHRHVHKTYLALTRGTLPAKLGNIDVPLHPARRGKMRPAAPGETGALDAMTEYAVLHQWTTPLGPVCLVRVHPRTGRHHQIRVHMRYVNAPLLVDPSYGRISQISAAELGLDRGSEPAQLIVKRLTLHAGKLEFVDPISHEDRTVEAPLAADLDALVHALGTPGTGDMG